jgi:glycosyltransferase involved in cell wall biosynthesis
MRILFLSPWFPYPPSNGSKIRIFNTLKLLAKCHEVSLLTFADANELADHGAVEVLRGYCSTVRALPKRAFHPSSRRALLGFFGLAPRFLAGTRSSEMRTAVAEELGRRDVDLVVASQLDMVPYALDVANVPLLLEELELASFVGAAQLWGRRVERLRRRLTWLKLGTYLRRVLPRFAACTVVSELERANVGLVAPQYNRVHVIPNAIDLTYYRGHFGATRPDSLVFAGALSYGANFDASQAFLAEEYPLILRAAPNVELRVTGGTAGIDLGGLPRQPGVRFTGYVDDIRPLVAQSTVSVVPLRGGGGTRLKILESMALGTPVVSTTKGAEGLDVTHGEDILIADGPAEFARHVVELLASPGLRQRLADGGRRLVAARYDWDHVGEALSVIVQQTQAHEPSLART